MSQGCDGDLSAFFQCRLKGTTGTGVVRIQFQRPAETGNRFIQFTLTDQGKAQNIMGVRNVWLQFDRAAAMNNRIGIPALLA